MRGNKPQGRWKVEHGYAATGVVVAGLLDPDWLAVVDDPRP